MTHMDKFPSSHIDNAELDKTTFDRHSKLEPKVILSNLITADAFEVITRDDSHSSDILCSNDPDINSFSDMNLEL